MLIRCARRDYKLQNSWIHFTFATANRAHIPRLMCSALFISGIDAMRAVPSLRLVLVLLLGALAVLTIVILTKYICYVSDIIFLIRNRSSFKKYLSSLNPSADLQSNLTWKS